MKITFIKNNLFQNSNGGKYTSFSALSGMVVCSGSTGNSSQPCRLLAITGHNATCVCSSAVASECDLNEAVVICQQHNNTEMHFQPPAITHSFAFIPRLCLGITANSWVTWAHNPHFSIVHVYPIPTYVCTYITVAMTR